MKVSLNINEWDILVYIYKCLIVHVCSKTRARSKHNLIINYLFIVFYKTRKSIVIRLSADIINRPIN